MRLNTILRRIQKLEACVQQRHRIRIRFGRLRRLPQDYQGPRHTEFVGRLPKQGDREWVEYREVPGPGPDQPQRCGPPECIDIIFVRPYAAQPAKRRLTRTGGKSS